MTEHEFTARQIDDSDFPFQVSCTCGYHSVTLHPSVEECEGFFWDHHMRDEVEAVIASGVAELDQGKGDQ